MKKRSNHLKKKNKAKQKCLNKNNESINVRNCNDILTTVSSDQKSVKQPKKNVNLDKNCNFHEHENDKNKGNKNIALCNKISTSNSNILNQPNNLNKEVEIQQSNLDFALFKVSEIANKTAPEDYKNNNKSKDNERVNSIESSNKYVMSPNKLIENIKSQQEHQPNLASIYFINLSI